MHEEGRVAPMTPAAALPLVALAVYIAHIGCLRVATWRRRRKVTATPPMHTHVVVSMSGRVAKEIGQ